MDNIVDINEKRSVQIFNEADYSDICFDSIPELYSFFQNIKNAISKLIEQEAPLENLIYHFSHKGSDGQKYLCIQLIREGDIEIYIDEIISIYHSGSHRLKLSVLWLLAQSPILSTKDLVLAACEAENPEIKTEALKVLSLYENDQSDISRFIANTKSRDRNNRLIAYSSLKDHLNKVPFTIFMEAMHDEDGDVRKLVCEVIVLSDDGKVQRIMLESLHDKEWMVVKSARDFLKPYASVYREELLANLVDSKHHAGKASCQILESLKDTSLVPDFIEAYHKTTLSQTCNALYQAVKRLWCDASIDFFTGNLLNDGWSDASELFERKPSIKTLPTLDKLLNSDLPHKFIALDLLKVLNTDQAWGIIEKALSHQDISIQIEALEALIECNKIDNEQAYKLIEQHIVGGINHYNSGLLSIIRENGFTRYIKLLEKLLEALNKEDIHKYQIESTLVELKEYEESNTQRQSAPFDVNADKTVILKELDTIVPKLLARDIIFLIDLTKRNDRSINKKLQSVVFNFQENITERLFEYFRSCANKAIQLDILNTLGFLGVPTCYPQVIDIILSDDVDLSKEANSALKKLIDDKEKLKEIQQYIKIRKLIYNVNKKSILKIGESIVPILSDILVSVPHDRHMLISEVLQSYSWQPSSVEEKVYFYWGLGKYDSIVELDKPAMPPLKKLILNLGNCHRVRNAFGCFEKLKAPNNLYLSIFKEGKKELQKKMADFYIDKQCFDNIKLIELVFINQYETSNIALDVLIQSKISIDADLLFQQYKEVNAVALKYVENDCYLSDSQGPVQFMKLALSLLRNEPNRELFSFIESQLDGDKTVQKSLAAHLIEALPFFDYNEVKFILRRLFIDNIYTVSQSLLKLKIEPQSSYDQIIFFCVTKQWNRLDEFGIELIEPFEFILTKHPVYADRSKFNKLLMKFDDERAYMFLVNYSYESSDDIAQHLLKQGNDVVNYVFEHTSGLSRAGIINISRLARLTAYPAISPFLIASLSDRSIWAEDKFHIVRALGKQKQSCSIPCLIEQLSDSDAKYRRVCVEALGVLKAKEAISAIEESKKLSNKKLSDYCDKTIQLIDNS
ncbi:MAG: HEAT repeat domain-containing protein [Pseudomonadales bacterium]|nr:HEAT repeat domain-containing protein [Pseudomonadales bacterium]